MNTALLQSLYQAKLSDFERAIRSSLDLAYHYGHTTGLHTEF